LSVLEPLVGLEVTQVWVWWSLRLVIDLGAPGRPDTYVDVTRFEFTDPAGTKHHIDVEQDPVGAGRVLSVLRKRVTEATATAWELNLTFDNGARLLCPPHPKYEAWAASIPGQPPIFCPPGGDPDYPG
jgi:Family of unknown function (DUF6188)